MSGPNLDNLRGMSGSIPSLIAHLGNKERKAHSVPVGDNPTKTCRVCTAMYDFKFIKPGEIEVGVCPKCTAKLADGWTALVSTLSHPVEVIFVKCKSFGDVAGKAMCVSEAVLERVKALSKETPNNPDNIVQLFPEKL